MNTWDEKNYIEPKKNCSNCNVLEPDDIMTNTKYVLIGKEWIDIGEIKNNVKKYNGTINEFINVRNLGEKYDGTT
jgi:hypothetical protein